jgi:ribonuclease J
MEQKTNNPQNNRRAGHGGRGYHTRNNNSHKKPHSSNNQQKPSSGPKKHFKSSGGRMNKNRPMKPMKKKVILTKNQNAKPNKYPKLEKDVIRIIPLGGVEQIGVNMTAIEMNDQIIVIDAGIGFSNQDTPGIDYMIPNTTYLEDNKDKVRALVITHGHLDHIGAIPYLYNQIGKPPIYTLEFGALLIKSKCSEFPGVDPKIVTVGQDGEDVLISDDFKVKFFGLTHSIPDSTGVIIKTKFGGIVSTGDVRVDNDNGVPLPKEIEQYKLFKNEKVLLMTMDSTGIPHPGWSASEREVIETIDGMIKSAPGRIIIASFASQVERLIAFIESAKKYGKYVVIEGRSMNTNLGIAKELKLADFSHVISADDMKNYPPHKIVMVVTGSQGEEFAALMRISNKTHRTITLEPSDTIVLSSSVVPGNDFAVTKLKDNLYRTDARIVTYMDNVVHASGHGKRGELTWIHNQIKYKFFMPIHGNHYMLKMHAELAEQLGCPKENVIVPDNGSIIEIRDGGENIIKLEQKVPGDPRIVDGFSVSEEQHLVIRDRKILAEDGIFVIIVMLDRKTKKLKKSPDLISRGFVVLKNNKDLLTDARNLIKKTVEDTAQNMNPIDFDYIKDVTAQKLTKFLMQASGKRPEVIPVILSS